jgi:membrane-associated phospholipid phosphatase
MHHFSSRHPLVVPAVCLVLFVPLVVLALRADPVGPELSVFRVFNDLPDALQVPTWFPMQFGALGFVPVAALSSYLIWKRRDRAVKLALAGMAAWIGSKAVKVLVGRERPQEFLPDANLRPELGGAGFVSGHTAVAFALATVLAGFLPRWARILAYGLAASVGALRMYVGAHLPLDIVGGAILGLFVGSIVSTWNGSFFATRSISATQPDRAPRV